MRKPTDTPIELWFNKETEIPAIEALAAKAGMKRKPWLEKQIRKIIKRHRTGLSCHDNGGIGD